jgi:hypothetical protein
MDIRDVCLQFVRYYTTNGMITNHVPVIEPIENYRFVSHVLLRTSLSSEEDDSK